MSTFKVIMFDLDDTLFDFTAWWDNGLRETLRTYKLTSQLNQEEVYRSFQLHSNRLWQYYLQNQVEFSDYRTMRALAFLKDLKPDVTEKDVSDFMDYFNRVSFDQLRPDLETLDLIKDFTGRYILGIATNGTTNQQLEKIKRLGLSNFISPNKVFISEQIGYKKPELAFFRTICTIMQVEPNEVVVVGDSWEMDIVGSIDAGLNAIWLQPKNQAPTTYHKPYSVIQSLKELRDTFIS